MGLQSSWPARARSGRFRTVALTDGSGGCQTVGGRIEAKRFEVFSSACVSLYDKRTNVQWKQDCRAFGALGPTQNHKLRVISVME